MSQPHNPPTDQKPSQPVVPFMAESIEQRERADLKRRAILLRMTSFILAALPVPLATLNHMLTMPAYKAGTWFIDPIILIALALTAIFLTCAFLSRPGISAGRANLMAYTMLVSSLAGLSIFELLLGIDTSNGAFLAIFLMIPLLAHVFGLPMRSIAAITLTGIVLIILVYLLGPISGVVEPLIIPSVTPWADLFCWVMVLGLAGFWVSVIAIRASQTHANLMKRMDQLSRLTTLLNSTNSFGSALSRELAGMTADLHITSRQQATNSQEQVAAVTEVTTSLEELNETANQIASSAAAAAESANQTVDIATAVRTSSEQARSTSQEGNEAVEQAVARVERVRNRIELLGQRLLHLTEQTRKVGTIIDIIDEIADETHLLALNASIEAAGSIHNQGGETYRSVRGDRFGVIAQEVKNLADRSRESTEEVRQAITEMQGAVAAAVLVAEEGKKETSAALSRSQIAGQVITKLNEIINGNAAQAEEILSAVEEVNIRCDEISIATGQQRSANQQILYTMRTVAQVSQESAGAVSVLSDTVSMVNRQVDQLNATLEKTNQSLQLAAV